MINYDGIIYGNGLTLNLIAQLKLLINQNKWYLLNIDDFLKAFINNQISPKEENRIFGLLYKSKDIQNLKYFEIMKNDFADYYKSHDANIEYWLGVDLFNKENCGYDFQAVKTLFPGIYNIWHEIMIDYFAYLKLDLQIGNFGKSVMSILSSHAHVYTTNFDRLTEELKPEHLHGIFIKDYKKYDELIFSHIDKESFYYKCLWGWNGFGKLNFIQKLREIEGHEKHFNFNFFYDKNFTIESLLVYGLGFQKSGYMKELSESMPKYKTPTIGGIVDEHILLRLNGLQTQGQLHNITFAYYADSDLQHYEYLANYFGLKNVEYLKSCNFSFSI